VRLGQKIRAHIYCKTTWYYKLRHSLGMINKLFIITIQIILIYGGNASRGTPHIAQIPLRSSRHVTSRHNLTRSTCWAHVFLAVSSLSNSTARHARHDELDTSNVLSPCILDVSSLSNSTARHVRIDAVDTSNVSSREVTWRAKWNLGLWNGRGKLHTQSINQSKLFYSAPKSWPESWPT